MISIIKKMNCLVILILLVMWGIMPTMVHAQVGPNGKAVPANRIVLMFQKDSNQNGFFEVIELKDITKVLPPSDELPSNVSVVSGFYYELQSANSTVLYRRIIENPILHVVEYDPNMEKLVRMEIIPEERVFALLTPRASNGDQLVIFSSPLETDKRAEPVQELARITLIPPIVAGAKGGQS